jgi:hypothetical protein
MQQFPLYLERSVPVLDLADPHKRMQSFDLYVGFAFGSSACCALSHVRRGLHTADRFRR